MDSWVNGEKGSKVKRVIDNNFDILDKRTSNMNNDIQKINDNIQEINKHMLNLDPYDRTFAVSDWIFNEGLNLYVIFIPSIAYNKSIPHVEVYLKTEDGYSLVYGGYKICDDGINLLADIAYEGRVLIR